MFDNATDLDDGRLRRMCLDAVADWRMDGATIRVRYSRGADFSGTCCYQTRRIFVNIGRHLKYPYHMGTHLARARSNARSWWKPVYTVELADPYRLALFVFLHECFHFLVKRARRNPRQKESMCDRFAARVLIDQYGAGVRDQRGRLVAREEWDFQDLYSFVEGARRKRTSTRRPRSASAASVRGARQPVEIGGQGLLFPVH